MIRVGAGVGLAVDQDVRLEVAGDLPELLGVIYAPRRGQVDILQRPGLGGVDQQVPRLLEDPQDLALRRGEEGGFVADPLVEQDHDPWVAQRVDDRRAKHPVQGRLGHVADR